MNKFKSQLVALVAVAVVGAGSGCDRSGIKTVAPQPVAEPEDMTVTYDVSTADAIREMKIKVKGTRGRVDRERGNSSIIYDPELGCFALDHLAKTYQKVDLKLPDTTVLSPEQAAALAAGFGEAFKLKFTGKTQKIGDWECEEFVLFDSFDNENFHGREMRLVAWIAKDFPDGKDIQARISKIIPPEWIGWLAGISSKEIAFPGFVVRRESKVGGKYPIVTTFTEITFGPLDAHEFELPADYREVPKE